MNKAFSIEMERVRLCKEFKSERLGLVRTGTHSFHFVPYCSEKWNAEGLRSDGNASNRTIPFQKIERLKK